MLAPSPDRFPEFATLSGLKPVTEWLNEIAIASESKQAE